MAQFAALPNIITIIWIAFEIGLMVRDRINGKGNSGHDRGTRYTNFIGISVGMTCAGIFSGNPMFFFPAGRSEIGFWVGIVIMLLGFGLRIWSVLTLGASFRTTIETHANQKVVSNGPYKYVRHPSYSGLILLAGGYGLAAQNWLSLLFAVILPLAVIVYRIGIEEAFLVSSIGSKYEKYQQGTKKLIPWVW